MPTLPCGLVSERLGDILLFDGATYDYYTTVKGIFEKVKEHAGDIDFAVQPELLSLLSSGDFGRYANAQGDMNVCFISNNDITGGNSGSAMFNAKGELLGLAFDGNWEAMSSDIVFEPDLQRCIGVDVRYMLFIIEKYGKAAHLIQELKWVDEVNIPMKPHFYRFNIITITGSDNQCNTYTNACGEGFPERNDTYTYSSYRLHSSQHRGRVWSRCFLRLLLEQD